MRICSLCYTLFISGVLMQNLNTKWKCKRDEWQSLISKTVPQFNCLTYCTTTLRSKPLFKVPFLYERVFQAPKRTEICNSTIMSLSPNCDAYMQNLTLQKAPSGKFYHKPIIKQLNWWSAQQLCRYLGMDLPSPMTPESQRDFIFVTRSTSTVSGKNATVVTWTSGTNMANVQQRLYWSNSALPVDIQLPSSNKIACLSGAVKVVAMGNDSVTWTLEDCATLRDVICEVPLLCQEAKCASAKSPKFCEPSCPDVQCQKKKTNFYENGTLKLPTQFKRVDAACGKDYVISLSKMATASKAFTACCEIGMKLVSFETRDEAMCLKMFAQSNGYASEKESLWTSGMRVDCGLFAWCATGVMLRRKDETWGEKEPPKTDPNSCILSFPQFNLKSGLTFCALQYAFMCESATDVPPEACKDNTDAYSDTNSKIEPGKVGNLTAAGFQEKTFTSCGSQILFSNYSVTHKEAVRECSSLGLRLLTLETGQKLNCVAKLFRDNPQAENIKYWTGGTWNKCRNRFWWGSTGRDFMSDPNMFVATTNTSVADSCIYVVLTWYQISYSVMGNDLCAARHLFICENETTPTVQLNSRLTDDLDSCDDKNNTCTVTSCTEKKVITSPNGTLLSDDYDKIPCNYLNRTFYVSKKKLSFSEAAIACCEMGMQLLRLDTRKDRQCIEDFVKKDKIDDPQRRQYIVTSLTNAGCRRRRSWCNNGKPILASNIGDNKDSAIAYEWTEPNYNRRDEECFAINIYDGFSIFDYHCEEHFPYVCQLN